MLVSGVPGILFAQDRAVPRAVLGDQVPPVHQLHRLQLRIEASRAVQKAAQLSRKFMLDVRESLGQRRPGSNAPRWKPARKFDVNPTKFTVRLASARCVGGRWRSRRGRRCARA